MTGQAKRNLDLDAAVADVEARYVAANPKSRARFEQACRTMPGANTRTSLYYDPFPVTIAKGQGSHIWDLDGNEYVDFLGDYTAGLYGHSNPVIQEAVETAMRGGIGLGAPCDHESQLADLMCARFPSLDMVRFTNSGTEGNLMAIGLARAVTAKTHLLVFEGSYHGGVLGYGGGGSPIDVPYPVVMGIYNDAQGAKALMAEHAADLAAVLVEPLAGTGGSIPGDPEFLAALREGADEHGIVLIFDEVMTSRLSSGGMQKRIGVTPDLTAFGKYLGGGMTFGAFGGRRDMMERFDPRREDALPHAGTFNNNVVTMAAGVAGLTKIFTAEAADALNERGDGFREQLNEIARRHGAPAQAVGMGSMLSIHLKREPVRRPADIKDISPAARKLFQLEMNLGGFFTTRKGFMSISLAVSDDEFDAFADAFDEFLTAYGGVLPD